MYLCDTILVYYFRLSTIFIADSLVVYLSGYAGSFEAGGAMWSLWYRWGVSEMVTFKVFRESGYIYILESNRVKRMLFKSAVWVWEVSSVDFEVLFVLMPVLTDALLIACAVYWGMTWYDGLELKKSSLPKYHHLLIFMSFKSCMIFRGTWN